jgi:Zn-dependent protease with chaperone function
MAKQWKADYYDGKTAARQMVEVRTVSQGVHIKFTDGRIRFWYRHEFRVLQDHPQGPVRLEYGEYPPEILEIQDPSFRDVLKGRHLKRPRYLALWLALLAVMIIPAIIYWGIPNASGWFARFVPVSVEEQLGNYVKNELFPNRRICQADAGRQALDELVRRLAPEEYEYNFKVEVVDSDWVNAVAFPGGNILIFRGLLEKSPSTDALAGVLAHEMQHILQRHGTENLISQTALSGLFKLISGDAGSWANTLFDGVQILSILKYTRELETEADESALNLLLQRGVDPTEMIKMYQVLNKHSSSFPEAISTHPDMSSRMERLKILISQNPKFVSEPVLSEKNWESLKNICQTLENK